MRRIYLGYADVSDEKQNDKQREMKIDDASAKSPKNWPNKKYFDGDYSLKKKLLFVFLLIEILPKSEMILFWWKSF